jgi:glycosyltransferase involved in cell wall biosynthesis
LAPRGEAHWKSEAWKKLLKNDYALVYANSIACLPWLADLKAAGGPRCVCAVHELTWVIERHLDKAYVETTLSKMDLIVAGSEAVRFNLIKTFSMPAGLIEVVHSFVPASLDVRKDKATLRRELGLSESAFVFGTVGTAELRKGIDLIAPIVQALKARKPAMDFKCVWVGGKSTDDFVSLCRRDAETLGVSDQLVFVDATPHANDYINLYDLFLLPSREDPFPLVVLSAIYLGKPIVAFKHSGGMDELLSDGVGCLVPYLDVNGFAAAIGQLLEDPQAIAGMKKKAQARVDSHYGVDMLARRLYELLSKHRANLS